jgi:hypothetical protein
MSEIQDRVPAFHINWGVMFFFCCLNFVGRFEPVSSSRPSEQHHPSSVEEQNELRYNKRFHFWLSMARSPEPRVRYFQTGPRKCTETREGTHPDSRKKI